LFQNGASVGCIGAIGERRGNKGFRKGQAVGDIDVVERAPGIVGIGRGPQRVAAARRVAVIGDARLHRAIPPGEAVGGAVAGLAAAVLGQGSARVGDRAQGISGAAAVGIGGGRDPAFGNAASTTRDRPTMPHSPWQNGHVERLIGSIPRECLDHFVIVNAGHLRRVLQAYARYYNEDRTHLGLDKDAPARRCVEERGRIVSEPRVGGLHRRYRRIARK
jgi:hypothetical protein